MPKGVPLTEEEQNRRRQEIFDAAVPLFLQKGFMETSMREIGDAAGVGKSTLYDYFKSKEEIMVYYFSKEIYAITERAQTIIRQNGDVTTRLKQAMLAHLEHLVSNKQLYLVLSIEAQRLSAEGQAQIQEQRHIYQDMIRTLIEDGIRKGEFRPVNPLLAARSIFTLLSTAVYTTRPTGTPEEMMEEILSIFFEGVKA